MVPRSHSHTPPADNAREEEPKDARTRLQRPRQNRKAPQAPGRPRKGRWIPPPSHPLPQIVRAFLQSCKKLTANHSFVPLCSHPGVFGKKGIRHFHLKPNAEWCPSVNLDKLWSLVSEQTRKNAEEKKGDKAPVIDVTKAVRRRS